MIPENPLVSIIIPTLNRAHLIGETLDSVLAQTYTNWECIVVDDGSTDNTAEIMKSYIAKDSRFQYHHRPKDRLLGGNAARNYGFEVSRGDYIQWFDSDDIMLPEFLSRKQSKFVMGTVMVICTGYSADANLENKHLKEMPVITDLFKDYMLWNSKIMLPSIMFKKEYLLKKGLFDETLNCAQESEFFPRILFGIGLRQYVLINDGLYIYRQHSQSKSSQRIGYNSLYLESLGRVSLANLELGIVSKDIEIINHLYKNCIHNLFSAINNNDRSLAWHLLLKLTKAVNKLSKVSAIELGISIPFFIMTGKSAYFIEKRFKNRIFKPLQLFPKKL